MPQLQVAYEPNPIPWIIPRAHDGSQRGPGSASVTLTVSAVDANSGASVAGMVNSITIPDPAGLIDDPNNLNFPTNTPQSITLWQVTSHEVPPETEPLYLPPGVQVTASGYEDAFLTLE